MLKITNYSVKVSNNNQDFSLNNINLSITNECCLILNGNNGSGKSTLLKAISNQLENVVRKSGSILLGGKYVKNHDVTFLNTDDDIIPNLTVYEHLLLGVRDHSLFKYYKSNQQDQLISEFYHKYLEEHFKLDSYADNFSKGERVLLLISTVLQRPSKIVLLDEPTANLDENNKIKIYELLNKIWTDKKFILILASHDELAKSYLENHISARIFKQGDEAIIPLNGFESQFSNLSTKELGKVDIDLKSIYKIFVEHASKNWEFGIDLNDFEKSFLNDELNNKRILIAGCGIGREAMYLFNHFKCEVICVDFSKSMLEECLLNTKNSFSYLNMNITTMQKHFLNNTFDFIISLGNTISGLILLADRIAFFKSCNKILKKNGQLIIDYTLASDKTFNNYKTKYKCQKKNHDMGSFGLLIDYVFGNNKEISLYQHYLSDLEFNKLIENEFKIDKRQTYDIGFERVIVKLKKLSTR